ncbi:MAG: hypothetical protein MI923_26560 [Phycisphaerales bacterium]|nr:hypothetical protein [Phycisphaerales bacterium]
MPKAPTLCAHTLAICVIAVSATGCQFGPAALRISHAQYNTAIQNTRAEQLLLNLVRLKYREAAVFLEVGSVSAQFVFDQSGDIAGTLNENVGAAGGNPDALRIGGRIGYTERPTITYSPLSGDDFVQRVLSPISIETIVLLTHSGWRIDRVLRLTVQEMNGLNNAQSASGPTPTEAPEYQDFAMATRLLRRLQRSKQLYLEYETRTTEVSGHLPAELITAESVVEAAKSGVRFARSDDSESYVLTRDSQALILRFINGGRRSPESLQLRDMLQLDRDRSRYALDVARTGGGGGHGRDKQGGRKSIAIDTRSLLGVMFYLSQGIAVPLSHREARLVTNTVDEDGSPFDWSAMLGDLFNVHVRKTPPIGAAVSVFHRGHWFFIRDDDQISKSTFSLLGQLFTLQAGSAKSAAPVLTLPVGG